MSRSVAAFGSNFESDPRWGTIKKLGRLPRWPEDAEHILDAEELIKAWLERCDDHGRYIVMAYILMASRTRLEPL